MADDKYVGASWGHFGHSRAILVYLEILWITQGMLGTLRGIVNRYARSLASLFLKGWGHLGIILGTCQIARDAPKITQDTAMIFGCSKDFQGFMIFNGCQWISKDFYGMSMIFREFT